MTSRYLLDRPPDRRDDDETLEIAWQRYEDDFQQRWPGDDDDSPSGRSLQLLPYRLLRRAWPRLRPPSYRPFLVDLGIQLVFYVPPFAVVAGVAHAFGSPRGGALGCLAGGLVMGAGIAVLNRLCDVFVPLQPWAHYLEKASRQ